MTTPKITHEQAREAFNKLSREVALNVEDLRRAHATVDDYIAQQEAEGRELAKYRADDAAKCKSCGGYGMAADEFECAACNGTGKVEP